MKRTTLICISVLLSGLLALPAFGQTEVAKLQASDKEAGDIFGGSVGISGDYAIVGASSEDSGGLDAGAAYIFMRDAFGNWNEMAKLLSDDIEAGDRFGWSVAISGSYAIVGAFSEASGGLNAGAAYIFELVGGTWNQEPKLLSSDIQAGDKFGMSVAIDGDRAIVGAANEDSGGDNAGAAYIFERNSSGAWIEVKKMLASDKQASDFFGTSVGISGGHAVVGASGEDTGGAGAGAAYIFEINSSGEWVEVKKLLASDRAADDRFGRSADISGDHAIIGAGGEDTGGANAGAAYFFLRASNGDWLEVANLQPIDVQSGDTFGDRVAISGNRAIIGANLEDTGGPNAGAAYFFKRTGNVWNEEAKIQASDKEGGDLFGNSVAISGNRAIVGANAEDTGGSNAGAAYIFTAPSTTIPSLIFAGLLNTAIVSPLCTVNLDALVCPGGFGPDAGLCLFVSNNCPAPAPLALAKTGVAAANPDDLFGVSIDLGEAEFSQVQFADFPVLPDNAFVTVAAKGAGDEIADMTLASIITTGVDVGGLATVEFDFGPTGADLFQVDIFDGDQSVFSGQILDNPKFEMIGPMFDVALPFRLTTPDPNGPMQASASYTEVTEIHVPDGPTVFGDRIVVVAENPELDVTQVSGMEVTASGIPQFILAQEALGLFDFPHSGLGEAQLEALGGSLTISNIGSSGEDGVNIDLSESLPADDNTLELLLDPLNLSEQTNPCFIVRGEGVIDGQPGAFGEVSLGGSNNQFDLTADFSGVGATQVQVFKAGLLQGTATAPNGIAGQVSPCFLVTDKVQVNRLSIVGTVNPCFIVGFENLMEFTDLQNNMLTGDEIRLSPQDASANSLDEFSSLALKAADLDAFTLTGETPGFTQPPALFFELSHSALGQALFSDDGGKLVVSNIGSSGLDGVAIDVDDGIPPADDALTVLLEPLAVGENTDPDFLTWQGVGLIDGKSGVFGRVTLGGSNNVLDLEADFSGVGATQVQVFKEGQLVGTASAPNGIAGYVAPCFLVTDKVQVNRLSIVGIVFPCFIVGFENLMEFTDLQDNTFTGDEIHLSPAAAPPLSKTSVALAGAARKKSPFEEPVPTLREGFRGMSTSAGVESFDTFTLQGAGLGQLTITDELLGLPQPSPEEVIDEVLTAIDALLADPDTPKKARKKLTAAKKKLISAKQKLAKGKMMSFFGRLKGAVAALEQAGDKSADVADLIDELVRLAARMAQETLAEARTYAGDPVVDRIIARAEASFAEAEARRAAGRFREAIQKYKETWKWAQRAISRGMPKQATEPEPVAVAAVPTEFELQQNYPNPFNPSTTITFALPQASEATLAIYNLRGQLLRTLHDGPITAGHHRVVWDGTDSRGKKAASGVYVYRLQAGERVLSRKLVLMK